MRHKLDTRFPASRIKKIMQADEDVGKIAMVVPLLVSKALELFLRDLCDQTYDVTLKRGAKTLSALHLKQCVHSVDAFDFLKEIVRNVPDFGNSDATVDPNIAKRRKAADVDDSNGNKESNKSRMETAHTVSRGRGRGRPRGRGRGRGSRVLDREMSTSHQNQNNDRYSDHCNYLQGDTNDREYQKENIPLSRNTYTPVHDFDLNMDLDENGELKTTSRTTSESPSGKLTMDMKHGDLLGRPFAGVEKMDVDSIFLANLNRKVDYEDEDYDEEG